METHTMEYNLAIKRNKVFIQAATRMNLENIMLSERSETQRQHIIWVHLYEKSIKVKSIGTESRSVVAWDWG